MKNLRPKQENFCNYYVESGNASDAYRRAYGCEKMKPKTVNRKAVELLSNGKITARVNELQAEIKAKSDIKKEDIVRLCARVLNGEDVTDYTETVGETQKTKSVSKTWAAERLCKMLGFDSPTELNVNKGDEGMSRDDMIKEIERLENLRNKD